MRERLNEEEETAPTKTKHVRENVSRIYDDGFHVCRDFYGHVVNKMQNVCFVMNCCLGSKHADSKKF